MESSVNESFIGHNLITCVCFLTELIAFPVGNIAGIIVGIVVVSMVIVKIVCVISGYERRMPDIFVNAEEQKQLFQSFTDPLLQTQNTSDGETQGMVSWKMNE